MANNTTNIFKNKFTLSLSCNSIEVLYKEEVYRIIRKYCLYFTSFFLIIVLISIGLVSNEYNHSSNFVVPKQKLMSIIFFLALALGSIYILIFPLYFGLRNDKMALRIINYINYSTVTLVFTIWRVSIMIIFTLDWSYAMAAIILEFFFRILFILFELLGFLETLILSVINYLIIIVFNTATDTVNRIPVIAILMYTVINLTIVLTSYFYTKKVKSAFSLSHQLEEKNLWYHNILERMNAGFLYIRDGKIEYMNRHLVDVVTNIETVASNSSDNVVDYLPSQTGLITDNLADLHINSEKYLTLLFENLNIHDITRNSHFSPCNFLQKLKDTVSSDQFAYLVNGYYPHVKVNNEILHLTYEISFRVYQNNGDHYEFIFNDVTQTTTREEMKAEMKYKTLFLSKIVHEFKNPIICTVELADQINDYLLNTQPCANLYNSQIISQNLSLIHSLSKYLLILVKDLDYFSESNTHHTEIGVGINPTEVDLDDVLSFCEEISKALLKKNNKSNILFTITKESNVPKTIKSDDIKLKQVLINLLSNSIKFTQHGEISLEVTREENLNYIKFLVRDSGLGMSEIQKKNLFKPFHKMEGASNQFGSGLGLSIVWDLSALLGERVEFTSDMGKGSQFWFKIPVGDEKNMKEEVDVTPKRNISMLSNNSMQTVLKKSFILERPTIDESQMILPIPIKNGKKRRSLFHTEIDVTIHIRKKQLAIIVADDEELTRQATIRVLTKALPKEKYDLHIFEAADGMEMVYYVYGHIMKSSSILFIVSDEAMQFWGGKKSAELLRELEKRRGISHVPFFLVSAGDVETDSDIQIDAAYQKPLVQKNVEEILRYVLRNESEEFQ